MGKPDWAPELIREELRWQLSKKAWPTPAIDLFFAFLEEAGGKVGSFTSGSVLMAISQAFAATQKTYPMSQWPLK